MMYLLQTVKQFIEEENYNALEVIYNADLAKLGKCAVISKKILLAEDLSSSSNIPQNDAYLRVMGDKRVVTARYISKNHFQYYIIISCSLYVRETILKSFVESRYLSGSYFILLEMTLRMVISHARSRFVCCHLSYMDCEIRHEIRLVTDYMSCKSGEVLVPDFGGPSDSFYCLFSVGSFLTLLLDIGNVAIWDGTMTRSPPWIRPCL